MISKAIGKKRLEAGEMNIFTFHLGILTFYHLMLHLKLTLNLNNSIKMITWIIQNNIDPFISQLDQTI